MWADYIKRAEQLPEHITYIAITIRVVVFSFQRVEGPPPL